MRNCAKTRKTGTRSRILPPRLTKRGGGRFSVRKALREELPTPVIELNEPAGKSIAPAPSSREADYPLPVERMAYDGNTAYNLYLREVGQTKLLTVQEENELAARIKKGDRKARERMIKANLRLVVKIAREYEDYGMPLLDLINEGNMGLMKAVERFDPAKGAKLSTYSAWWIKQAIKRALANQSKTIRLPVHVVDKLFHMRRASVKLQELLGREPTDDELGEELGLTGRKVAQLRTAAIRPASLEAPLGDDETSRIADVIADESADTPYEHLEGKANIAMLRELIATLHPREAEILRYRFGLDGGTEKFDCPVRLEFAHFFEFVSPGFNQCFPI